MTDTEERGFSVLAKWLVPRRRKVHIVIFIVTLLMIPGALTALEPIDIESYELDSPEILAMQVIEDEFSAEEHIMGFVVAVRDPALVEEDFTPRPMMKGGSPDVTSHPPASEMVKFGGQVHDPPGGILNLSVLREVDYKAEVARNHALGSFLKPLVDDVTGGQTDGVLTIADIFRNFMTDNSILTREGSSPWGPVPPATNWSDCGELDCLQFDDQNLTQAHIDLAAIRMAEHSDGNFIRWLSLDRAFVEDANSNVIGPDGKYGRWSATSSWLLVQFDKAAMEEAGWSFIWKESTELDNLGFVDGELNIGGYRLVDGEFWMKAPEYDAETCGKMERPCSAEWSMMHLEGVIRATDNRVISLSLAEGINIEVNREIQSSFGLIILMGLAVMVLLWLSLRRLTDVVIVGGALALSLLWMQGTIGHLSILGDMVGFKVIHRSQFSNLLPILILALGIDDSLHALHRYKEERKNGKTPKDSAEITVARVGRAIMLTTITTMAAFSSNFFSDIAALRSFGLEAGIGVACAFVLTGIWAPLVRLSVDEWMDQRNKLKSELSGQLHLVPTSWLKWTTVNSAGRYNRLIITGLALLITIPAAYGMASLEGDFKVEDFLEETSDVAVGVNLVQERFTSEGEPASILIEGDVADPRVFAAIEETRINMDQQEEGFDSKLTRVPSGKVDIHAIDEIILLAMASLIENSTPFEEAGWDSSAPGFGVGCNSTGGIILLPDFAHRGCLIYFYGFTSLYGVPASNTVPGIPSSVVALYIYPEESLDPERPWLTTNGDEPVYPRMQIRFGITQPEDFPSMAPALEELERDLEPFANLSAADSVRERLDSHSEEFPVSWVMWTDRPITRYVAASSMQEEMQSSLLLGIIFVIGVLWVGFRSLPQALLTTVPILLVVIWLYGMIYMYGYNLNLVTVAIAAISLGVGIDYCIHVTERYREERAKGANKHASLMAVGGASGLALVGSAASDATGFLIIAVSPMGLFASFGLFSAMMILLSLLASMVLTTAAIGLLNDEEQSEEE